jgi:hypothetical protein
MGPLTLWALFFLVTGTRYPHSHDEDYDAYDTKFTELITSY